MGTSETGRRREGDSFNILPQLYQYHDRCDQDAITGSMNLGEAHRNVVKQHSRWFSQSPLRLMSSI